MSSKHKVQINTTVERMVAVPACVQPNHTFFFDTDLTMERMKEISEWIGTLPEREKTMLKDLINDVKREESWFANSD